MNSTNVYEELYPCLRISKNYDPDRSKDKGDIDYQPPGEYKEAIWRVTIALATVQCVEEYIDLYHKYENDSPKTIVSVYGVGDITILKPYEEVYQIWLTYTTKVNNLLLNKEYVPTNTESI